MGWALNRHRRGYRLTTTGGRELHPVRHIDMTETGDLGLAEANVTPGYVNHRSVHEPLPARGRGYIVRMLVARCRERQAMAGPQR